MTDNDLVGMIRCLNYKPNLTNRQLGRLLKYDHNTIRYYRNKLKEDSQEWLRIAKMIKNHKKEG